MACGAFDHHPCGTSDPEDVKYTFDPLVPYFLEEQSNMGITSQDDPSGFSFEGQLHVASSYLAEALGLALRLIAHPLLDPRLALDMSHPLLASI